MKTLYLLRHAKAERDSSTGEDFDRPLAARGLDDAAMLGTTLQKTLAALPGLIVSSPSRRTMETVEQLTTTWPKSPAIQCDQKLYLAPARILLDAVRSMPDLADGAMLVGHNPGMAELAVLLANRVASEPFYRLQKKFPTCALATFEIAVDRWARAAPDLARLLAFSTPKDRVPNHLADGSPA